MKSILWVCMTIHTVFSMFNSNFVLTQINFVLNKLDWCLAATLERENIEDSAPLPDQIEHHKLFMPQQVSILILFCNMKS